MGLRQTETFYALKCAVSLTKPVSSDDRAVHSFTNHWPLRLSSIRAPRGATASITATTQDFTSLVVISHTHKCTQGDHNPTPHHTAATLLHYTRQA